MGTSKSSTKRTDDISSESSIVAVKTSGHVLENGFHVIVETYQLSGSFPIFGIVLTCIFLDQIVSRIEGQNMERLTY